MIEPLFGPITPWDIVVIIFLNQAIFLVLFIAILLMRTGHPRWISRKLVHILSSTGIALVVPQLSNISAITVTLLVFLAWLLVGLLMGLDFKGDILEPSRRETETPYETFLSPFVFMIALAVLLVVAPQRMEIFSSGVLALGWGDGAGEVFGRRFGAHHYLIGQRKKTLEGTLGVVAFTFFGILVSYLIYNPARIGVGFVDIIFVIAIIVGGVEALCLKWTDNILIPLATGCLLLLLMV